MTGQVLAASSRALRRTLVFVVACAASLALASTASARPTGEYANFADCPLSNPATSGCIYALSNSGEFAIGSTTVPLSKPVTLQGGLTEAFNGVSAVLPAADANTLSKSPQTVPGGLFKIVAPSWLPGFLQSLFNEFVDKGLTGVTATTELVGTAHISAVEALLGQGTALELPVRVHLENAFLGGSCYVGSASKPVTIDFTTGTTSPPLPNDPITGSPGEVQIKNGGALIIDKGNRLVNNSFAAPEAEGCGGLFSFLIDPAVDAEIGLPSGSGHNTAILEGSQELGSASAVRSSEG